MSITPLALGTLIAAALLLSFVNGANDNFKGVATLFGSRTATYRAAIWWATAATFAGSMTSLKLADKLVKTFSGRGIVPDALTADPHFLIAVGLGAAATVLVATRVGMPVSTTHAIIGALVGAGFVCAGDRVSLVQVVQLCLLPLLASPVVALVATAGLYFLLRSTRRTLGVPKELCVCAGPQVLRTAPIHETGLFRLTVTMPIIQVCAPEECRERYVGVVFGVLSTQRIVDGLHYLSAATVSFGRGLNDSPKIFGILYGAMAVASPFGMAPEASRDLGLLLVSVAMALGGLVAARRVGETLSLKVTEMNPGQAFTANLVTGWLVTLASFVSVPVSTTHVSTGSLFGIRAIRTVEDGAENKGRSAISNILLAWVLTLPTGVILSAAIAALGGRAG